MHQTKFWAIAPFGLLTILGKPLLSPALPIHQAVVNFSYVDESSTKSEIFAQDTSFPKVTPSPEMTPTLEDSPSPEMTPTLEDSPSPEMTPTLEDSPSPEMIPPTQEPEIILQQPGMLSDDDLVLPSDESVYDEHTFEGTEGQVVTVTVESPDFDTYLAVFSPDTKLLGEHDDISKKNTNSQLTITLPMTGKYRVIVNSYDKTGRGEYNLQVIQSGQTSDF